MLFTLKIYQKHEIMVAGLESVIIAVWVGFTTFYGLLDNFVTALLVQGILIMSLVYVVQYLDTPDYLNPPTNELWVKRSLIFHSYFYQKILSLELNSGIVDNFSLLDLYWGRHDCFRSNFSPVLIPCLHELHFYVRRISQALGSCVRSDLFNTYYYLPTRS